MHLLVWQLHARARDPTARLDTIQTEGPSRRAPHAGVARRSRAWRVARDAGKRVGASGTLAVLRVGGERGETARRHPHPRGGGETVRAHAPGDDEREPLRLHPVEWPRL